MSYGYGPGTYLFDMSNNIIIGNDNQITVASTGTNIGQWVKTSNGHYRCSMQAGTAFMTLTGNELRFDWPGAQEATFNPTGEATLIYDR